MLQHQHHQARTVAPEEDTLPDPDAIQWSPPARSSGMADVAILQLKKKSRICGG